MSLHQQLMTAGLIPRVEEREVFLLAEGSAHEALRARLEFHDTPHRSLWRLEGQSALEKHAPLLFTLAPDSTLDDWLGSIRATLPLTVLSSRLAFDDLWRHLRRFSKFQDAESRYWLRLGDPSALERYVGSLAYEPGRLARFFDLGGIDALYFLDSRIGLARQAQPLFEQALGNAERDGCLIWRDIELGEGC
ncbi:DUF4123 domain-containing protein [Pseudomonas fontis]|uniref:DUF4123 domain-containing protein n=1 Tax=Pseudomonas fontis TaxID=2942633 RepID=A0ABT5NZ07_9PSED|nr:DUF4123 domain-containing protein [Pseudomonas fontis]MDD0977588.1 DUF4123 domain-containing protein [Pseudomonas fontis]MDD0993434.1 DUF4123 domain-containing protein [Pseudomonas fontis]